METRNADVAGAEAVRTTGAATRLGFAKGQVVVEFGDDKDTDADFRDAVEQVIGSPIEPDDYDGVTDVVLVWWREGDGDLADELMDALSLLVEGGHVVLMTPGAGREDRVAAHDLQEGCTTCSLTAAGGVPVDGWVGQRLTGRR